MDGVYRTRLDALEQAWQVWAGLGAGLTEDHWSTGTRCAGWDVAALYAHHSVAPVALSAPLPTSDAPGEPLSASEILRGFNAPGGIAHTTATQVEEQAVTKAAQHPTRELVDRFRVQGPQAIQRLRRVKPTLVMPWGASGTVTTAVEAVRILLLEATVHLLDAQHALGRAPAAPPAALAETARLLAELAPAVEFIEAATGRSAQSPLPVLR